MEYNELRPYSATIIELSEVKSIHGRTMKHGPTPPVRGDREAGGEEKEKRKERKKK